VDRNDGSAAIEMLKKMVTAFDADDLKSSSFQTSDDFAAAQARKTGHIKQQ
jgi:hypothetical protein